MHSYMETCYSLQSTAIYQAKQKLDSISKANSRQISSEELIKFAHRISASNGVAAPPTWAPGEDLYLYTTRAIIVFTTCYLGLKLHTL